MALWIASQPLVLASKSEVRRKILDSAAIPLDIRPTLIDERAVEAATGPISAADAARVLALAKANAIAAALPDRLVLGADQTLVMGTRRFSKPTGRAAARMQLHELSGRTHELHSAIALVRGSDVLLAHCASASLTMRVLSDKFLDRYFDAAGDTALASVGAYQIEHAGIHLFERIDGDFFTILGMPLLPLLDVLRRIGAIAG